ncbi:ATP-binding protein [Roseibium suaedae]|uniref:histidine kinase n=1 Tax=Roseibium suaedae TaxID=735517 RepID=A0A1M7BBB1_9HYPH|nr:ATP-binding protein [Roseibium suaedae]SHL51929.1 two-component system, OmpR family, phosphate regulon sensor histidine kinase PhoR [Roseibium suaedae]
MPTPPELQDAQVTLPGPWTRIVDSRWPLLVAAAMAAMAVLIYRVPWSTAVICFLVLAIVIALAPVRVRSRRLQAVKQREMRRMWPGTGMKVTVDALSSPCFVADGKGVTRYVNKAALDFYGEVRPGDPLSFALRAPSLLEAFDRVAVSGKSERISWGEKVPAEAWFEAHIAPVYMPGSTGSSDEGGQPDFILVVVYDQSEQRRLERMRSDFIANASHELRTPLASLSGFIETLQGPAKNDPDARDRFLAIMHEQASRMRRLIDDILSLSRIEMKANVKPSNSVDLTEVVRHSADALAPLGRELEVEIETETPADTAIVKGDRDELIQVTENLLENAMKYGSSGKRVVVSIARSSGNGSGGWCLSVRDFGDGIAAEHLPRLTERFYRVDVGSSRTMKGTGLGLAIVKHIIARHRARLEIVSKPGEGACFSVHFPAA